MVPQYSWSVPESLKIPGYQSCVTTNYIFHFAVYHTYFRKAQTSMENTAGLQTHKINGIHTEFPYMCEVMYTLQGTPDSFRYPTSPQKLPNPNQTTQMHLSYSRCKLVTQNHFWDVTWVFENDLCYMIWNCAPFNWICTLVLWVGDLLSWFHTT